MSTTPTPATADPSRRRRSEIAAWWITFGALTLAIITMLSLWN